MGEQECIRQWKLARDGAARAAQEAHLHYHQRYGGQPAPACRGGQEAMWQYLAQTDRIEREYAACIHRSICRQTPSVCAEERQYYRLHPEYPRPEGLDE